MSAQPLWYGLIPQCTDECPEHDGKRCRIMGMRPDRICEPMVGERVAALAAAETRLLVADNLIEQYRDLFMVKELQRSLDEKYAAGFRAGRDAAADMVLHGDVFEFYATGNYDATDIEADTRAHAAAAIRALAPPAAEAARECHICGQPATCRGQYETMTTQEYACDDCCGHANEDGRCRQLREPEGSKP